MSTFLDKMRAKSNGHAAAPPPPPPPETPQVASEAPPAPKAGGSFLNRAKASQAPVGVVPPDAPPRDSGGADPLEPEVSAETGDEVEVKVDAPAPEAPKTRGRPKGSTKAAAEAKAATQTEAEVKPTTAARKEFVIWIDTMQVKGPNGVDPTLLEDWFGDIEMALNDLALEEKLPHWMLMGFGPQKAALAIKVQEKIAKGLPSVMVVNSSSPVAREVLPMLIPHATRIYRSTRG